MKTFTKIWLSIGLIAIGIGIGLMALVSIIIASRGDNGTVYQSMKEAYDEDIRSLDIDIAFGKVDIIEGDGFSIDAEHLSYDLKSYVKDGVWIIEDESDGYTDFFGINIPLKGLGLWDKYLTPRITITVPEGFEAEDIFLSVKAGRLKAENLVAKRGDLRVDAGQLKVDNLVINETSRLNVGAGEIVLDQMSLNDIRANCNVGSIKMSGVITGANEISCDVGSIEIDLEGSREDYLFDISSDLGNVIINNDKYHNINNKRIMEGEFKTSFTITCDVGEVKVKTR